MFDSTRPAWRGRSTLHVPYRAVVPFYGPHREIKKSYPPYYIDAKLMRLATSNRVVCRWSRRPLDTAQPADVYSMAHLLDPLSYSDE
ncbi:hypothetical protein RRG08_053059 [Elysia crispata]|uniref:Uncharacterized protein n=1 Tax=Elysia crispata TaxID=231223 RepID=A0AAE1CLY5_9GAST|nr:hypothetical protein RRG08_053059 [Elysia crispata]